jgi:hypothetical protein
MVQVSTPAVEVSIDGLCEKTGLLEDREKKRI